VNPLEPAAATVEAFLAQALAAGSFRCGQVAVRALRGTDDGYELRHQLDAGAPSAELTAFQNAEDAAEIARYTDAGVYRPLKTAPDLRRGWSLRVATPGALRLALDLLYPGRLGAFVAFGGGRLRVTSFRETLGRQTGMYRVTQKLTDGQADALIGSFCRSDGGCLRTILWKQDDAGTPPSSALPEAKYDWRVDQCAVPEPGVPWMPLLCQEACNLLVAEARRVVKGETKQEAGE
jgi:sirohydrochlorin cobaltochelatase